MAAKGGPNYSIKRPPRPIAARAAALAAKILLHQLRDCRTGERNAVGQKVKIILRVKETRQRDDVGLLRPIAAPRSIGICELMTIRMRAR